MNFVSYETAKALHAAAHFNMEEKILEALKNIQTGRLHPDKSGRGVSIIALFRALPDSDQSDVARALRRMADDGLVLVIDNDVLPEFWAVEKQQ